LETKASSGTVNASTSPRRLHPSLILQLPPHNSQQILISLPMLSDIMVACYTPYHPPKFPDILPPYITLQQATSPLPLLRSFPFIFLTQSTRLPSRPITYNHPMPGAYNLWSFGIWQDTPRPTIACWRHMAVPFLLTMDAFLRALATYGSPPRQP